MALPEPDEHDIPVAIDMAVRRCPDLREGLDRIAMNLGDTPDRIPGRKYTA
jgi:hypothetical protein